MRFGGYGSAAQVKETVIAAFAAFAYNFPIEWSRLA